MRASHHPNNSTHIFPLSMCGGNYFFQIKDRQIANINKLENEGLKIRYKVVMALNGEVGLPRRPSTFSERCSGNYRDAEEVWDGYNPDRNRYLLNQNSFERLPLELLPKLSV